MSNDLSSEILSIRSEVNSIRADVAAVTMSQGVPSIESSTAYVAGVDFCEVKDPEYQQSRARSRGVNRIFSLSDGDDVMWVIERPTWLKETGSVYSICSSRMCEYYGGNSTIYRVCCGKLEGGKAEPGTFYMGKSGDSITVAFRKTSDNRKDLSCYLGEYDTAIAIGAIYKGESKPTVLVCGAITPGGGSKETSPWPWKTEIDEDSGAIRVYDPSWHYVVVDKAARETDQNKIGSRFTHGWVNAGSASEDSVVFAKLSSRSDKDNPECEGSDGEFPCGLSVEICTSESGDACVITPDASYVRLGTVKKSETEEVLPDGTSCTTVKYSFVSDDIIKTRGLANEGIQEKLAESAVGVFKKDTCGVYKTLKEDGEFYDASCKYKYIATHIAHIITCLNYTKVYGSDKTIVLDDDKKPTEDCSTVSVRVKDAVRGGGYEVVPFLWANFLECNCSCALTSDQSGV